MSRFTKDLRKGIRQRVLVLTKEEAEIIANLLRVAQFNLRGGTVPREDDLIRRFLKRVDEMNEQ